MWSFTTMLQSEYKRGVEGKNSDMSGKHDRCGVYRIRCIPTGEIYVGSSSSIYKRWSQHRADLRACKHANYRLQHRWTDFGEEAFKFAILEFCSTREKFVREQYWIDLMKPKLNIVFIVEGAEGNERRPPRTGYLTLRKAAQMLGIHPKTLLNWRRSGEGPVPFLYGKRRYFTKEILESWIKSRTVSA